MSFKKDCYKLIRYLDATPYFTTKECGVHFDWNEEKIEQIISTLVYRGYINRVFHKNSINNNEAILAIMNAGRMIRSYRHYWYLTSQNDITAAITFFTFIATITFGIANCNANRQGIKNVQSATLKQSQLTHMR